MADSDDQTGDVEARADPVTAEENTQEKADESTDQPVDAAAAAVAKAFAKVSQRAPRSSMDEFDEDVKASLSKDPGDKFEVNMICHSSQLISECTGCAALICVRCDSPSFNRPLSSIPSPGASGS